MSSSLFLEGTLYHAPFPRMGGKVRPAACVFAAQNGAAVFCPGTSAKSAQGGRIYLPPGRFQSDKPTWLLAPLATLFPAQAPLLATFSVSGALDREERDALYAALDESYGRDWRACFERRAARVRRPTRLDPLPRARRRKR